VSNQDKNPYKQQENDLSMQSNAFVELLTKRGLLEDQDIDNEDIRKARKAKKRNMYHNTLQLLRHYRDICWLMEAFPAEVAEELDRPFVDLDALLNMVDMELGMENRKLESRLSSLQRSRLLVDRLNEAITVIRKKPGDGERMYEVIYHTYLAPDKLTHLELLEKLNLSSRQYYRYREQAIKLISLRLWSVPNSELDAWLEVISLLEML